MRRYFLFTLKAKAGKAGTAVRANTEDKNLYAQLLAEGYPRQSIHKVLHHLTLQQAKQNKATGSIYDPPPGKPSRAFSHRLPALRCKPQALNKDSHFLKNLASAVVSLLKTQFAKKPKNPV